MKKASEERKEKKNIRQEEQKMKTQKFRNSH